MIFAASLATRWSLSDIWNSAGFLETASALSTLILIIGAVVEEWPKLKQIGLLTVKWIAFRSTAFERCVLKKLITHSIGAILVVVGIVGELVFETRTFIVEDRETAILNTKAGDAATSAHNAAIDAGTAHTLAEGASDTANAAKTVAGEAQGKANSANATAGKAEGKASAAGEKANELDRQLAITKAQLQIVETKRAELDESLKPRKLCSVAYDDGTTNFDSLKPLAGHKVIVESIPDFEARQAAAYIVAILRDAGLEVVKTGITNEFVFPEGVMVGRYQEPLGLGKSASPDELEAEKLADTVSKFLRDKGWVAYSVPTPQGELSPDMLRIRVGYKPSPYFTESETPEPGKIQKRPKSTPIAPTPENRRIIYWNCRFDPFPEKK